MSISLRRRSIGLGEKVRIGQVRTVTLFNEMKHIIAYFDILGYKSYLASHDAIDSAETVFSTIESATQDAAKWFKRFEADSPDIDFLIISDTIILSLPWNDVLSMDFPLMLGATSFFCERMFDLGLPVRGVVEIGAFVNKKNMIAGKAVVDAHLLSQSLDFSGAVISENALEIVRKICAGPPAALLEGSEVMELVEQMFPKYLCPLKSGREKEYRIAQWLSYERPSDFDSTTVVREAFWKLKKSIPASVDSKVFNTAKMLDFLKMLLKREREKDSAEGKSVK